MKELDCLRLGSHKTLPILVAQKLHHIPACARRPRYTARRVGPHAGQVKAGQPRHRFRDVAVRALKLTGENPGHKSALPVAGIPLKGVRRRHVGHLHLGGKAGIALVNLLPEDVGDFFLFRAVGGAVGQERPQ